MNTRTEPLKLSAVLALLQQVEASTNEYLHDNNKEKYLSVIKRIFNPDIYFSVFEKARVKFEIACMMGNIDELDFDPKKVNEAILATTYYRSFIEDIQKSTLTLAPKHFFTFFHPIPPATKQIPSSHLSNKVKLLGIEPINTMFHSDSTYDELNDFEVLEDIANELMV